MRGWPLVLLSFALVTLFKIVTDDQTLGAGGMYVLPLVIATAYGWRYGLLVMAASAVMLAWTAPALDASGVGLRELAMGIVLVTFYRFDLLRQRDARQRSTLALNDDVLQRLVLAYYELEKRGIANANLEHAIAHTRLLASAEDVVPGDLRRTGTDPHKKEP